MNQEQIELCTEAFKILIAKKGLAVGDEYKPIFEGLESVVGKTIVERIKKLDLSKKRCVLLADSVRTGFDVERYCKKIEQLRG